ncbi:hypothetical protein llap_5431 [Limosa lapponica baueri]|uniref:Uncharacterized protein n=1 Tax=Limosa lapponica baueri TaxID=1758121 RepID=A0A2I0UE13_LIMLA|nr:hypothetical protein llap_5431 [Limosa lapponica baueri]
MEDKQSSGVQLASDVLDTKTSYVLLYKNDYYSPHTATIDVKLLPVKRISIISRCGHMIQEAIEACAIRTIPVRKTNRKYSTGDNFHLGYKYPGKNELNIGLAWDNLSPYWHHTKKMNTTQPYNLYNSKDNKPLPSAVAKVT